MPLKTTKFIWHEGKLVPWEKATVHVLAHALHYGSSVFEGDPRLRDAARCCRCSGCGPRPAPVRLRQDLSHRRFPTRRSDQRRVPRGRRENGLNRGAYMRPFAFRGYGEIGVAPKIEPPRERVDRGLGMGRVSRRRSAGARRRRLRVVVAARRAEHDPGARARPAGNYLSSQLDRHWKRAGSDSPKASGSASTATVSEGAGENLFLIQRRRALHADRSLHAILPGITRDTVMTLAARSWAFEVREQAFRARCCISPTRCS